MAQRKHEPGPPMDLANMRLARACYRFNVQMPLMTRWAVYMRDGRRSTYLGVVRAPNDRLALAKSIRLFNVPVDRHAQVFVAVLAAKR
jgi:hypothetical protein